MTDIPVPPPGAAAIPGGPEPRPDDEIARLADLHTRLIDTLDGYDKAAEKAEPEFLGVVEEFRALHQGHARVVMAMLSALGHDPEADGSVIGTVNRAVIEVRSWFTEIGHNIMDGIADGEKRVLGDMEAAIAAATSIERRAALDQMRGDTITLLQRHAPDKA
ncbi:MAG: DUF2383 domain-containing protein [Pararhodobacter sp.]|nr:DUF2383 domain-containing protein [Pararhodobacter sp.]